MIDAIKDMELELLLLRMAARDNNYTAAEIHASRIIDLAGAVRRESFLADALRYHQEQTQPIQRTIDALAKAGADKTGEVG